MDAPSYLDPSTVEWCEKCRCKTWHVLDAAGARVCEWHQEEPPKTEPAPRQPEPEVRS